MYAWGNKSSYGLIGVEHDGHQRESIIRPSLIESLAQRRITSISCGNNYTLAIDDEGNLFSWGYGRHGVLGLGDEEDRLKPTLVKENICDRIVYVDAGFSHCGIVTEDGKILMAGKGENGELGLGSRSLSDSMFFRPIRSFSDYISSAHFKELSCSKGELWGYTLALTTEGKVYSWGNGCEGQLGIGNLETCFAPGVINPKDFNDEEVVHICAGGSYSVALTTSGKVFSWGFCVSTDPRIHQTTVLKATTIPSHKDGIFIVPKEEKSLRAIGKVVDIKSSCYHTVVLIE